jgi:hypothetical protein
MSIGAPPLLLPPLLLPLPLPLPLPLQVLVDAQFVGAAWHLVVAVSHHQPP